MTIVTDIDAPPCTREPVFRDERLYLGAHELDAASRAGMGEVLAQAHRRCAGCPMLVDCLYRAVVEVDVSGFVACTTEADRAAIRDSLGIVVDATPTGSYGPRSRPAPAGCRRSTTSSTRSTRSTPRASPETTYSQRRSSVASPSSSTVPVTSSATAFSSSEPWPIATPRPAQRSIS